MGERLNLQQGAQPLQIQPTFNHQLQHREIYREHQSTPASAELGLENNKASNEYYSTYSIAVYNVHDSLSLTHTEIRGVCPKKLSSVARIILLTPSVATDQFIPSW
jgi:hypothetical protein